jgi:hypothetical protein
MARIKEAIRGVVATDHWATTGRIEVTLFHFPDGAVQGDIKNILNISRPLNSCPCRGNLAA